jgi:hypothetical protein
VAAKTYSARVMRFRKAIYRGRDVLTPGAQVLLLRLSDDMNVNAIVSIPRSTLAEEFDCAPARITEWINQAKKAGYLDIVRRARPGVTAVYQGLNADLKVREGVPQQGYGKQDLTEVRQSGPPNRTQRYARAGTQEVVAIGTSARGHQGDVGSNEESSGCSSSAAASWSAS